MHRDYEEEALLFAKVANIDKEGIFNKKAKILGCISSDCHDQYLSIVVIRYSNL